MSVLNENQLIGASGAGTSDYEIEQSLRFDEGRETRLIRTPTTNGSATTWTWSAWVKRSELSNAAQSTLFAAGVYNGSSTHLHFASDNTLHFYQYDSAYKFREESTQVFRDTSAWYHVVAVVDTTNGTAADRIKLYVNGVQITSFANVLNPNQNQATFMNLTANKHYIGDFDRSGDGDEFGGYLAEINFIDGLALTPDSFGETGTYGEWKPIAYAGTYGTNGFYLPFEQDYSVEGFSTVVYEGNQNSSTYIGGTGFQPDLVWGKNRSSASNHWLFDSVRGTTKMLQADQTNAEETQTGVTAFDTDGFTLGTWIGSTKTGDDYVAWNWDMGGTTASNTSGSITSSVRANTTYGQSVVRATYSGSGTQTFGHGLGAAPDLIIGKAEDHAYGWGVYHSGLSSPETKNLSLNTTAAAATSSAWGNTLPTSSVFSVNIGSLEDAGYPVIFYCFSSVTGYSKFGSYSGNGNSTGPVVTLGFSPAFVMIKRTDTGGNGWVMLDNTRNPFGNFDNHLEANTSAAETDNTGDGVMPSSTGFQLTNTYAGMNASGGTYIYAAFADTREYAYWYDQSGNNNDWTSEGGLTESDVMVDSPTNNFATINPLAKDSSVILQEGNLLFYRAANMTRPALSTISLGSTQKWYCEFHERSGTNIYAGVQWEGTNVNTYPHAVGTYAYVANADGGYYQNGSYTAFNSSMTSGDKIRSIAYDAATGKMWIGANGTFSGNPAAGSGELLTVPSAYRHQMYFVGAKDNASATTAGIANFGQDSSFAGNKTPQGNQDSNDIGDFYYAPPTGFLALCTANLPDVDVIPSENFNAVIYSGTGNAQSITVGFQPDLTWFKSRSASRSHVLVDSVRGVTKELLSDSTAVELTSSSTEDLTAFTTDGFNLGTPYNNSPNESGASIVAWNWKAGGSAVSNTNGTITSSVSANPSAGFSIVSYTGTGANATVGHGLSVAPEMIIVKNRDNTDVWLVYHDGLASDPQTDYIILNRTDAKGDASTVWNDTAPTSTVFSIGSLADVSRNNSNLIAYCFHSVDGYSRVGSFVGNGSTDGPFVHCGFKPAWVMVKRTDASGDDWHMMDIARSPFNLITNRLKANSSDAEATNDTMIDSVSNGFKLRNASGARNASGGTYIFLAFAESPFKNTNAR